MPKDRSTNRSIPDTTSSSRRQQLPNNSLRRDHVNRHTFDDHIRQRLPPRFISDDDFGGEESYDPLDSLPPVPLRSTSTHTHRQPSAHLSEIGSVDENHFSSQVQNEQIGQEEYDNAIVKYGQDQRHRSRSTSRHSAREGNVSGQQGYAEEYRAMPPPEAKHPSAHRLAQAKEVSHNPRSSKQGFTGIGVKVGRSIAPQAFQPNSADSSSRQDTQRHVFRNADRRGPTLAPSDSSMQPRREHGTTGAEFDYPPPPKPVHPRSKLNQSTRFDTPSEKGGRGQTAFHPSSASRSSEVSYVPKTSRKRASHTVDLSNNLVDDGSPAAIRGKHRSRGDPITTSIQSRRYDNLDLDAEIEIDGAFDLGEEVQHDWQSSAEQDGFAVANHPEVDVPPSSPSHKALPLVHHLKPIILPSSEIEDILPDLDDEIVVLDEEMDDGSLLKLKMPKTVDQVVKYMSNLLAKKVCNQQGEVAIKSCDSWTWTRLPVLAGEIEASLKEMEQKIHIAGQDKQAGIEETKRKRVDLEAGNTDQYEEFRADFRDACEKMQQPARLGKKFKFGPF